MGEAGVTFALFFAVFAEKYSFFTSMGYTPTAARV